MLMIKSGGIKIKQLAAFKALRNFLTLGWWLELFGALGALALGLAMLAGT